HRGTRRSSRPIAFGQSHFCGERSNSGGLASPGLRGSKKISHILDCHDERKRCRREIQSMVQATHSVSANSVASSVCKPTIRPVQWTTTEPKRNYVNQAAGHRVSVVQALINPSAADPAVGLFRPDLGL